MPVHIRHPVREQPDTGYRKSLPPYFLTFPDGGGGTVFVTFHTHANHSADWRGADTVMGPKVFLEVNVFGDLGDLLLFKKMVQ